MPDINPTAFIQARMNSSRYPGKSLAPLAGIPVIKRVINRVNKSMSNTDVVVVTTNNQAEDPLVSYLRSQDEHIFCGHPTNVFKRFRSALEEYPCECFFRICGDSPFLEPTLFTEAINIFEHTDIDIATNVLSRDFPAGKTVELLDTETFQHVTPEILSNKQQEHVTKYFYDNSERYNIKDITCPNQPNEHPGYAVDTLDDLKRLESWLNNNQLNDEKFKIQ
jgi:spore coat polysaccharide biosynthesis protein SpsF